MRNFTRRMRATASSSRCIGTTPLFTSASRLSYSPRQLSGAMYMSRPALIEAGQSVARQPRTWPWPFQSPTMKPWKPMRSFSTSVSRPRLPCIFSPFQLLYEAMTDMTPAPTAGT